MDFRVREAKKPKVRLHMSIVKIPLLFDIIKATPYNFYMSIALPIPIKIKNLIVKPEIIFFQKINSPDIKSEINNQRTSEKKEEKTTNKDLTEQGQYIILDPIAIDPYASYIWNKVF